MKVIYRIIGTIGTILLLNYIVTWIFVSKNNVQQDNVDSYIQTAEQIEIKVSDADLEDMFNGYSYLKQIILYKGITGGSRNYTFIDANTGRYYKIVRFDGYGKKFTSQQTNKIDDQELYVKVDPLQYNNNEFGTRENPILIFWYKGANKELMTREVTDEMGENGKYIYRKIQLSPSEEEYRYNVTQYLTYVMPKEEFKQRFK